MEINRISLVSCLVCLLVPAVSHHALAKDPADSVDYSAITSSWWDEDLRRELLAKAELAESNFVAICVGNAKVVCSMPRPTCDDEAAGLQVEVLKERLERMRDFRRHTTETWDGEDLERLKVELRETFDRYQRERDNLDYEIAARALAAQRREDLARRMERELPDGQVSPDASVSPDGQSRQGEGDDPEYQACLAELRQQLAIEPDNDELKEFYDKLVANGKLSVEGLD